MTFFGELQEKMVERGDIFRNGSRLTWSDKMVGAFGVSSWFRYSLEDVNVSIVHWASTSFANTGGNCSFIEILYRLLNYDLCIDDDIDYPGPKSGTLKAICPQTCGLCGEGASEAMTTRRKWPELLQVQRAAGLSIFRSVTDSEGCSIYGGRFREWMPWCSSTVGRLGA